MGKIESDPNFGQVKKAVLVFEERYSHVINRLTDRLARIVKVGLIDKQRPEDVSEWLVEFQKVVAIIEGDSVPHNGLPNPYVPLDGPVYGGEENMPLNGTFHLPVPESDQGENDRFMEGLAPTNWNSTIPKN